MQNYDDLWIIKQTTPHLKEAEKEKWKKIQSLEAKKSALSWLKRHNFSET